jgi:hypothetical protein
MAENNSSNPRGYELIIPLVDDNGSLLDTREASNWTVVESCDLLDTCTTLREFLVEYLDKPTKAKELMKDCNRSSPAPITRRGFLTYYKAGQVLQSPRVCTEAILKARSRYLKCRPVG